MLHPEAPSGSNQEENRQGEQTRRVTLKQLGFGLGGFLIGGFLAEDEGGFRSFTVDLQDEKKDGVYGSENLRHSDTTYRLDVNNYSMEDKGESWAAVSLQNLSEEEEVFSGKLKQEFPRDTGEFSLGLTDMEEMQDSSGYRATFITDY